METFPHNPIKSSNSKIIRTNSLCMNKNHFFSSSDQDRILSRLPSGRQESIIRWPTQSLSRLHSLSATVLKSSRAFRAFTASENLSLTERECACMCVKEKFFPRSELWYSDQQLNEPSSWGYNWIKKNSLKRLLHCCSVPAQITHTLLIRAYPLPEVILFRKRLPLLPPQITVQV